MSCHILFSTEIEYYKRFKEFQAGYRIILDFQHITNQVLILLISNFVDGSK